MNPIFQQIETEIMPLNGWATFEKAVALYSYTIALKPKLIVEIGTWGGKSAIPMMFGLRENGRGEIICIDPWKADESVKGQTSELDRKWWSDVANHELVYQHFLYMLDKLGLKDVCQVWRQSSDDSTSPCDIDIFHCDGNHGPQAVSDVQRFAPNVVMHGLCVLDDLDWHGGYVRQAEKWLLENGFMLLHPLGTGAVYMRVK